ncbi:MAG: stalk domain-containing protein [Vulcanimicrobiaceae bacterium]
MIYRRPALQTLVLTGVVALVASAMLALSHPAELRVDGQPVESDVPPITTATHRVFVPLRALADALGAQTVARGDFIYVIRGKQSLRLRVGDRHATLDGMPLTFKRAPFRVRGRVMIGMKGLALALNVHVTYDARTARIDVLTPGIGQATASSAPATQ